MLKKLLATTVILAVSSSVVNAAPYVAASVGVQANTSNSGSARVMPATIAAGYGAIVAPNIYMAGELFVVPGSAELNDYGVKTTYGYGISFIPGVMLSDHTMGYARAGLVRSQFSSPRANATGGQLGLGMQTSLTQNWDLRGEYVYTAYRSISGANGISSPKSDQFNLGVMYKFQ